MVGMEHFEQLGTEELVAALRAAGCVYAQEEASILESAAGSSSELASMLARRIQGYPLEHIVGWVQFYGLRMAVVAGVFVPRRRSEFLVQEVLAAVEAMHGASVGAIPGRGFGARALKLLDLCCGSGALGAALAHVLPGVELHAADIDPVAAACAAGNIAGVNGHAYCGDLFEPLPKTLRGNLDVVVANAPYVPTGAIKFMPQEARVHEPDVALNGGADGLEVHRKIAEQAPLWLRPGGLLFLESSTRQAPASAAILAAHGFSTHVGTSQRWESTVVSGVLELGGR